MKKAFCALAATLILWAAMPTANAGGSRAPAGVETSATELSAARKKTPKRPRGYYVEEPRAFPFPRGDSAYVNPSMEMFRQLGRCVIDLGYGRFEFCDGGDR